MLFQIAVMPENHIVKAPAGENLLTLLRGAGFFPDAPCGGSGKCGKCRVFADGQEVLACQTVVDRNMTVTLPQNQSDRILTGGISIKPSSSQALALSFDIGTTTVAAYLTENGEVLSTESRNNPQASFGADVVSRIRHALAGQGHSLTAAIRQCVEDMTAVLTARCGRPIPERICVVGNPAMVQLFLGMAVDNLAAPPFTPLWKEPFTMDGGDVIPLWAGAQLRIAPCIWGYLGADTVACILACGMAEAEELTLLVDIGTNGEMVLGNRHGFAACATAAGPALEGAEIRFGMQAATGAIDRVDPDLKCHVIGGGKAAGICGSGLVDAVAAALGSGLLNQRGRILTENRILPLPDGVFLTQEDIRQFQQAKGAIAAGIRLLAGHLGVALTDIRQVYLAGAFGTFLDPRSACRTGLIPPELERKITAIGNAAGSGARLMACDDNSFSMAGRIAAAADHLDLAASPGWAKAFAQNMYFDTQTDYWRKKAVSLGFTHAVPLDPGKLTARSDVRAMCAADKCRAYGKNHTCPPHCGTLEECQQKMRGFSRGILVQTVGILQKTIDSRAYRETERRHLTQFHALAEAVRKVHPEALCLGSGGCRVCKECAFPEPCRFPEKACASMEGYGLFVTHVCRDSGIDYHHGEKTVTYCACVLF